MIQEGTLHLFMDNIISRSIYQECFICMIFRAGNLEGLMPIKVVINLLLRPVEVLEVFLDDGEDKRTVLLNRPYYGLHVPPGIWAAQQSFSSGSICLVLASENYDEADYIRDYEEFLKIRDF